MGHSLALSHLLLSSVKIGADIYPQLGGRHRDEPAPKPSLTPGYCYTSSLPSNLFGSLWPGPSNEIQHLAPHHLHSTLQFTPQPLPPETSVPTPSWSIHSLCPCALKLRVFLRTRSKHTTPLHKKHPVLTPCPPLCARGFPDHLFTGPSNSTSCHSLVLT